MSVVITNVSTHDSPVGEHDYVLKINSRVLCSFTHRRQDGLAACLRAAADAWEKADQLEQALLYQQLNLKKE